METWMARTIRSPRWLVLFNCCCWWPLLSSVTVGAQEFQTAGNQAQATAKKDQCSISGTVVALAGGGPLRKAHVRLESADDRMPSTTVMTDGDGRFELKAIDPGRYRLQILRVGYVNQTYG